MNTHTHTHIYTHTILLFDFPMIYYIDYNIKIKVDEYVKFNPPKINLLSQYIYIFNIVKKLKVKNKYKKD